MASEAPESHADQGGDPHPGHRADLARAALVANITVGDPRPPGTRRSSGGRKCALGRFQREVHGKGRTGARARALGPNDTAVRLDDVLDDREPEAEPSFAAPRRRVALAKTVEDVWQEHRVDALARVTNDDSPDVCVASDAHDDVPAGGGELEGVGH